MEHTETKWNISILYPDEESTILEFKESFPQNPQVMKTIVGLATWANTLKIRQATFPPFFLAASSFSSFSIVQDNIEPEASFSYV